MVTLDCRWSVVCQILSVLTDASAKLKKCGSKGTIVPHKTYESNFIHRNFVQIGKQHSRYKAILSPNVLLQ